jgi:type I restriction enzyme R subunit
MSLENVNFDEAKQSQLPAVELLLGLGYKYLSCAEALELRGGNDSKYLLGDVLRRSLARLNSYKYDGQPHKFSDADIAKVAEELESIRLNGLIDTSREISSIIMPDLGGSSITVYHDGRHESRSIRYFDFDRPENNEYHVTVEYKVTGRDSIRCDIVCFVNGIPLVTIENKKSSVGYQKAINQQLRYQKPEFAPKLFAYTQLLFAMDGEHAVYGTTGTAKEFYAAWREKDANEQVLHRQIAEVIAKPIERPTYEQLLADLNGATYGITQQLDRQIKPQDIAVYGMLRPERLMALVKHFVFYDGAYKKVARYQQYFAIQKMLARIEKFEPTDAGRRRKGGIIWHTQGSGKSLTMVMFVRVLIEYDGIINPRIIIVTDRIDLDKQIEKTFAQGGLKKQVKRMSSGTELLRLIKDKDTNVLTTLVQKFDSAGRKRIDFVDPDDNIFVLIDEAHRSQSGDAAAEMEQVIPNACFIAFTGTPLLKKDKSRQKFGDFIDCYTIDDALEDGVVLPLIYEGRYVALNQNKEQVDRLADRVSEDLSAQEKYKLARRVEKRSLAENPSGVEEICNDIQNHFVERFQNTGLKGQVVAPSKHAALLMQNYFERWGKVRTALILSDENGEIGEEELKKQEVADYLHKVKAKYASLKSYEDLMIEEFTNNSEGVELLVVVDKLLTGFDAPCDTVLYLAKQLQDHNLLQAIARVNRLFDNPDHPKTAGFIIDYSENAANIHTAMQLFGNYDPNDVKSALIDVDQKIHELDQKYGELVDQFKGVAADDHAYIEHLRDEPTRRIFKDKYNELLRVYEECRNLRDFATKVGPEHFARYRLDLKKFADLKKTAELQYGDQVDLRKYEREISRILDQHVTAQPAEVLTGLIEVTDRTKLNEAIEQMGDPKSKAEAIAKQTIRRINARREQDEALYNRFSDRIAEILQAMHDKKMADIEALKQLRLLDEEVEQKKDDDLPERIKQSVGADIFYRNLQNTLPKTSDRYEQVILELTEVVRRCATVDWWRNFEAKRRMRSELDDYLYDVVKVEYGLPLEYAQIDSTVEAVLTLAENNHDTFTG